MTFLQPTRADSFPSSEEAGVPAFSGFQAHPDSSGTHRKTMEDNVSWFETAVVLAFSSAQALPGSCDPNKKTVNHRLPSSEKVVVPPLVASHRAVPVVLSSRHCSTSRYMPVFFSTLVETWSPARCYTLPRQEVGSHHTTRRSRSRGSRRRVSTVRFGSSREVLSRMLLRPFLKRSLGGSFRPNRFQKDVNVHPLSVWVKIQS